MPRCLGTSQFGAREQHPAARVVRARAPQLLPVDDALVAVALRARRQPRQVRAAAGLAEELAPGVLAGHDPARSSGASGRRSRAPGSSARRASSRHRSVYRRRRRARTPRRPRRRARPAARGRTTRPASVGQPQPESASRFRHSTSDRSGFQFASSQARTSRRTCSASITAPSARTSVSRCQSGSPRKTSLAFARLKKRCTSCSQVKPSPPWIWIASAATCRNASEPCAFASDATARSSSCFSRRSLRRVVRGRACELEREQHVGALVLDRLERADRPPELHARLGVLDRHVEQALRAADHLVRERGRGLVRASSRARARLRRSRPAAPRARRRSGGAASLRVGSSASSGVRSTPCRVRAQREERHAVGAARAGLPSRRRRRDRRCNRRGRATSRREA